MGRLRDLLQQIVEDINKCLNESRWNPKELSLGKSFVIHEEWLPLSPTLVKKYREAGWIVKLNVEVEPGQRQYILNIRHPETSI